jgi:hypothetical protein
MRIVIKFGHWQHTHSRLNEVFSAAAGPHVAQGDTELIDQKNEDNTFNFV